MSNLPSGPASTFAPLLFLGKRAIIIRQRHESTSHLRSSEVNSFNDRNYKRGIGRKMADNASKREREREKDSARFRNDGAETRDHLGDVRKRKNLILPFAARIRAFGWLVIITRSLRELSSRLDDTNGGEGGRRKKENKWINGVVADRGKLLAERECA